MPASLSQERAYMRFIEVELRRRLNVPERWVHLYADEEYGWSVEIALNVSVEDDGDGERGPHVNFYANRWVTLVVSDQDRWFLRLFDLEKIEDDFPGWAAPPVATLHVQDLDGVLRWDRVAEIIGNILESLGVIDTGGVNISDVAGA